MDTGLPNVRNDIILNMDNGKVTAFTLLDLSAVFVTINRHNLSHYRYADDIFKCIYHYLLQMLIVLYNNLEIDHPFVIHF